MVSSTPTDKTETTTQVEEITTKNPPKWCSVSLSDVISRGKRLDASVFDVEAKQAWTRILKGKYGAVLLGNGGIIKTAYYPGRFKRIYCSRGNGEPFFLPSQMSEIYPKAEKYISPITKCNLMELRLQPNTLLLTRSGTIGTVSYVSKTIQGQVYSDDVIRVTFEKDYDLGYIYTFLKSKTGNKILTTNGYGAVITHLEPEHLSTIPIPNAPIKLRQKINNLIVSSFDLRDESNKLIDDATALLTTELQLPDIDTFDVKLYKKDAPLETFNIKLSNMTGRLDASYHVPIVNAITSHLRKYAEEVTTIGDPRVSKGVILPGRFKRVYVEQGYGRVFIGGKQLYELDPSNKKYLSNVHHGNRIAEQLELHENMTLITCSGTIGKVALVGKHWENWTANQHIIRIIPANHDIAGYLNIFLASDYGFPLITRHTYGSVVDEIDDHHVRAIPVPLLKNHEVQKQINDLALEANQKRYEAYLLEQEALQIMDTEVIYAK
ncbi:MAG: restriction endonuclease subunit S [Oscillospiraceae bacterium]|jgi:type I restriction enzyme S subunit|nr:restriction endonuclease subunit S [Oscillospiraceae bacterium]